MSRGHQFRLPFAHPEGAARQPPPLTLRELLVRAKALHQRTIGEVAVRLGVAVPEDGRRAKGFIGQLAERALGADPTAGERPDFPDLGVELKTIPLRLDGLPAQSTFVCSVTMAGADTAAWETSRLRRRLGCVLWLPILPDPSGADGAPLGLGARAFGSARLWIPTPEDLDLLRADWEDLMGALGSGHAVSAREGQVLQMRPKAAHGAKRTIAPGEGGGSAKLLPMGFYLRPSFTAHILSRGETRIDEHP